MHNGLPSHMEVPVREEQGPNAENSASTLANPSSA